MSPPTSPMKIPTSSDSGAATSQLRDIGPLASLETIELVKPDAGGLGLMICEHEDSPGVFVQKVVFNKPAYLDQRLKPGDRILTINGHSTTNTTQDYVFQLLQVCVCAHACVCVCVCVCMCVCLFGCVCVCMVDSFLKLKVCTI